MRYFAALFCFALAACASVPEARVSDAQLASLVQGRTSVMQTLAALGEPSERRTSDKGAHQLVYGWRLGQTNGTTVTAGVAAATITSDRREIVLTYGADDLLTEIERRTLTTKSGYMSAMLQQ